MEYIRRVLVLGLVLIAGTAIEQAPSVFAITERMDMGLYEVPLSMYLLDFGMGTMLANFHMCGFMFVLRVVFSMLVGNTSPRWPMCFRLGASCFVCQDLVSCYF